MPENYEMGSIQHQVCTRTGKWRNFNNHRAERVAIPSILVLERELVL